MLDFLSDFALKLFKNISKTCKTQFQIDSNTSFNCFGLFFLIGISCFCRSRLANKVADVRKVSKGKGTTLVDKLKCSLFECCASEGYQKIVEAFHELYREVIIRKKDRKMYLLPPLRALGKILRRNSSMGLLLSPPSTLTTQEQYFTEWLRIFCYINIICKVQISYISDRPQTS